MGGVVTSRVEGAVDVCGSFGSGKTFARPRSSDAIAIAVDELLTHVEDKLVTGSGEEPIFKGCVCVGREGEGGGKSGESYD